MDLKRFFELQQTFNERVGLDDEYFARHFSANQPYKHALIEGGQWIDDMLKALSSEIEELRNCTYWKHWCSEAQNGERYKIKDLEAARKEVIDILHFWISLCQILGMSADTVSGMYETKLAKNLKRQDDGYSIKVKDLAWELFQDHDHVNPDVMSLEDLPESDQRYWLDEAKKHISAACDTSAMQPENLCDTCVHEENDCSTAAGWTHSYIRYARKGPTPTVAATLGDIPTCSKCGCKCMAGYAMTGEGPICGSCV